MKRIFLILAMAVLATAHAATNDLTGLLQKGLFEEEANRNLDGAISNYQSLATAFDKDRQVAATAIFRLGECYRKLGRTNEAAAQYQRIVTDFSDQQTLVTLSQQNLAGINLPIETAFDRKDSLKELQTRLATAEGEYARKEALLKLLKGLTAEQLKKSLPTALSDKVLDQLILERDLAEESLVKLRVEYTVDHPKYKSAETILADLNRKIDERQEAVFLGFQLQVKADADLVATLKSEAQKLQQANQSNPQQSDPIITDEEEKEIRRIQQLIQNSPDLINAPSGDPALTPLGRAASQGQLRVAKFLLNAKALVNQNTGGMTPLQHAASHGHRAMVELLLANGADVSAKGSRGRTALHSAAERGFVSVSETLIAAKADPNGRDDVGNSPLTLAVQNGFRSVAELLLAQGSDANVVTKKTPPNWGLSESMVGAPLHFAALREDEPMVALLLKNHADTKIRSPNFDKTALDIAVEKGSTEIVRDLLQAGADPNLPRPNADALTPLYRAVNEGTLEVVNLLLEKGADPNQTCYWLGHSRMTPLMQALIDGKEQVARALLQNKADPNLSNEWASPLALLVQSDRFTSPDTRTAIAKLLIDSGANINSKDANGNTALHIAIAYKRPDIVELLLADHADINVVNAQGQTPLDFAKQQDSGTASVTLSGPVPSAIPRPGSSNLESGRSPQQTNLVTLLRQHGAMDELPNYSAIRAIRQGVAPIVVFQRSSNDWNHFTLLETIYNLYSPSHFATAFGKGAALPFPDLTHITIIHPTIGSTNTSRTSINLMNSTNGIDCSKNVPLEFGDLVQIPEREYSLAERPIGLTDQQQSDVFHCVSGAAKLVTRGQTIELRLISTGLSRIAPVLDSFEAKAILMASSDLAHVKVTRRNGPGGKKQEWILDCSDLSKAPDLWIRDGDVIEVPEK